MELSHLILRTLNARSRELGTLINTYADQGSRRSGNQGVASPLPYAVTTWVWPRLPERPSFFPICGGQIVLIVRCHCHCRSLSGYLHLQA
jgi:hypothetical protein